MVADLDVEHLLDGLFDRLDTGIAKFHYFSGIGENHMVVLSVEIGFLILRLIFAELMLSYQFTFQQQFNGIVQRGPTHPVVFILHVDIERFDVEMLFAVIDFLQEWRNVRAFFDVRYPPKKR